MILPPHVPCLPGGPAEHGGAMTTRVIRIAALLLAAVLVALATWGCATCPAVKPCPPPQVTTVTIPLPVAPPAPAPIERPVYLLPLLDLARADAATILGALYTDLERAIQYGDQLAAELRLYREAGNAPLPPPPAPPQR